MYYNKDAMIPLKELSEKVNSSVATCQRRVQTLTDSGVITKQVAVVSQKPLGVRLACLSWSKWTRNQHSYYQELFERKMRQEDEVVSCYEISGDYDLCCYFMQKIWKAITHSHVSIDWRISCKNL